MSVGPLGWQGSFAGTPLAQVKGSDVERSQVEANAKAREEQSGQRAEMAGGIGEAEEEKEVLDRDADGRRMWEPGSRRKPPDEPELPVTDPPASKDATGQAGRILDVSG